MLKGSAENGKDRKLWGEQEGKQSWVHCGGGWKLGGREGRPRENESKPGDGAWEGCSEDARDCFKVPLYRVNEFGNVARQVPFF